jgi:arylsulfatase
MMGDRAIYHDGWILSNKVGRRPWDNVAPPIDLATTQWELYDLANDWTQNDDVAAKYPAKVKQLKAVFEQEAKKYQVLPLDNSFVARAIVPKPSITAGRNVFTWTDPMTGTPNGDAPSVLNASYSFKAEIEVSQGGAEGMLITQGGRFGGYGFYLLKGKPVFLWNLVDVKRVRWEGPEALAPGKHVLEFDFKYEGMGAATMAFGSYAGIGQPGTGVLKVDGREVATQKMERTIPFILQFDESLDVGSDTLTGVNDADYQPPFKFTGKINKITLTIDRPKLSPADVKKLQAAQRDKKAQD